MKQLKENITKQAFGNWNVLISLKIQTQTNKFTTERKLWNSVKSLIISEFFLLLYEFVKN